MVNTKTMGHVFKHPKYYEELRKLRKQDKLPRGNLSLDSEEKRQASSGKSQAATINTEDRKQES